MGLLLSRKVDESIHLDIAPGTTPDQLWEALQEGITIQVDQLFPNRAVIFIDAPRELQIYRPDKHDGRCD